MRLPETEEFVNPVYCKSFYPSSILGVASNDNRCYCYLWSQNHLDSKWTYTLYLNQGLVWGLVCVESAFVLLEKLQGLVSILRYQKDSIHNKLCIVSILRVVLLLFSSWTPLGLLPSLRPGPSEWSQFTF